MVSLAFSPGADETPEVWDTANVPSLQAWVPKGSHTTQPKILSKAVDSWICHHLGAHASWKASVHPLELPSCLWHIAKAASNVWILNPASVSEPVGT